MNETTIELDRRPGKIEVSPGAIATAAGRVVLECYGVVGIAKAKLRHGKAELLDDAKHGQGIVVRIRSGTVNVEINIIVEYGTRISEVAHNVIAAVRSVLQSMLGEATIHVSVNVQGLRVSS